MGTGPSSPRDDDPRLAGFEHAPEPAFVTDGGRHRIVAVNATGRSVWGEHTRGVELGTALPDLDSDQLDCWTWVLQTQAPIEVRIELESRREPGVLELVPWPGPEGVPRGVLARLRRDLEPAQVVTRMQEALLPEELPVLPQVDLAAALLLADGGHGAAGDWFDAVLTPAGAVALVVGDVAGRGAEAIATMTSLRAVLRERLLAGAEPADALSAVGGLVSVLPGAAGTTIGLAVVHPGTGEVTYCTAGHPAPLVVDPGAGSRRLAPTGAAALGVGSTYPTLAHALEPGQMLVLHSDAVRGRRDLGEVLHAAVASIGGGHGIRGTVDRVCQRVLADVTSTAGSSDDLVLVAAERMPFPSPLELRVPAVPTSVRELRIRLGDWLDDLRPGELDASAILHAAGELVSNAVEHAYAGPDEPGTDDVVLRADLAAAGDVVLSVHDGGRWRPADDERAGRGRGLVMAAGLVDRLDLDRGAAGTTATVRHRIGRPVMMFHRPPSLAVRGGAALDIAQAGPGRVLVSGEVDEDRAGVLRVALLHHSRVGTSALTVDLSDVSLLSSAAVRVLAEAVGWGTGPVVALVAAPGSIAAQVLDVVGLPYAGA